MTLKREPDIETALGWWDEMPNKWTPIGWRDHTFRFNVLFNGTTLAEPCLSPRGERWKGLGVQVSCAGNEHRQDDGSFEQGWEDHPTPVLWTQWQHEGFLVRQSVFAHAPAGVDPIEDTDPLYAWVRLEIVETCEPLPVDERCRMMMTLQAPHVRVGMSARNNISYAEEKAAYPRELRAESAPAFRLLEPDGKVRLAMADSDCEASFEQEKCRVSFDLPGMKGAKVDLLIPMLPTEPGAFDAELALGWDPALTEADAFWSELPSTAALFDCPEEYINRAIRRSLQLAQVTTERSPYTGAVALMTGSLNYQAIWATPIAMTIVLFLDMLGYHDDAGRYLEVFRKSQGAVRPPSDCVPEHPGYLGSPREYKSIDWLTDHGAVLWAICEHVALSGCRIDGWLPVVENACKFIRDARAITGHGGVEGVMPPAVNTDMKVATQSVWSDGWNYLGLATATRLLEQIGHPMAPEFAREARAYKTAFLRAFRAKAARMPKWTAPDGSVHPIVPTALSGENPRDFRIFYLDTGPLFLVFAGLLSARDPLMKSALRWFREGPQTKWYKRDAGPWQLPCLDHEISSCEPGYSWNVYHSHQLGNRSRFLEGMYSLFAGGMSQQTYTACETRGGITGLCNCLPCVPMARLAIVDDRIEPGALHLLRMVPAAWVVTDRESRFERMPTRFGRVSIGFGLSRDQGRLTVDYRPEFRAEPGRVVLHVPPVRGLREIAVNGERLEWDGKQVSRGKLILTGR